MLRDKKIDDVDPSTIICVGASRSGDPDARIAASTAKITVDERLEAKARPWPLIATAVPAKATTVAQASNLEVVGSRKRSAPAPLPDTESGTPVASVPDSSAAAGSASVPGLGSSKSWQIRTVQIEKYGDINPIKWRLRQSTPHGWTDPVSDASEVGTYVEADTQPQAAKRQRRFNENTPWRAMVVKISQSPDVKLCLEGQTAVIAQDNGTLLDTARKMKELPVEIRAPDVRSDSAGNKWTALGPPSFQAFLDTWGLCPSNLPTGFVQCHPDPAKRDPHVTPKREAYERAHAARRPQAFADNDRLWFNPADKIATWMGCWLEPTTLEDVQSLLCHEGFTREWRELSSELSMQDDKASYRKIIDVAKRVTTCLRWHINRPRHEKDERGKKGDGLPCGTYGWGDLEDISTMCSKIFRQNWIPGRILAALWINTNTKEGVLNPHHSYDRVFLAKVCTRTVPVRLRTNDNRGAGGGPTCRPDLNSLYAFSATSSADRKQWNPTTPHHSSGIPANERVHTFGIFNIRAIQGQNRGLYINPVDLAWPCTREMVADMTDALHHGYMVKDTASIFATGQQPMDRVASMHSSFPHFDKRGAEQQRHKHEKMNGINHYSSEVVDYSWEKNRGGTHITPIGVLLVVPTFSLMTFLEKRVL